MSPALPNVTTACYVAILLLLPFMKAGYKYFFGTIAVKKTDARPWVQYGVFIPVIPTVNSSVLLSSAAVTPPAVVPVAVVPVAVVPVAVVPVAVVPVAVVSVAVVSAVVVTTVAVTAVAVTAVVVSAVVAPAVEAPGVVAPSFRSLRPRRSCLSWVRRNRISRFLGKVPSMRATNPIVLGRPCRAIRAVRSPPPPSLKVEEYSCFFPGVAATVSRGVSVVAAVPVSALGSRGVVNCVPVVTAVSCGAVGSLPVAAAVSCGSVTSVPVSSAVPCGSVTSVPVSSAVPCGTVGFLPVVPSVHISSDASCIVDGLLSVATHCHSGTATGKRPFSYEDTSPSVASLPSSSPSLRLVAKPTASIRRKEKSARDVFFEDLEREEKEEEEKLKKKTVRSRLLR